jgi:hypothetical protein
VAEAAAAGLRPGFRGVAAQVLAVCRARWPALLLAGLLVFVPLSLVDVLTEGAGEIDDTDLESVASGLVAIAATGFAAMIGEAVYAGMVAGIVVADREGRRRPVMASLRHLPYVRLFAVDLLAAAVILLGLLALIVPGLVFMAWFALVAPAVEVERLSVLDSFRRSRELVRGHAWLVIGLLLPILIVQDALSSAAQSASLWGLGEGFAGDYAGALLANLLTSPFYALAVTVLFFELRAARPSADTAPRSSRRSHRAAGP